MFYKKAVGNILAGDKKKKSILSKILNFILWAFVLSVVLLLSSALWAYYLYVNRVEAIPFKLVPPEFTRVKTMNSNYQVYVSKYPDYTNGKTLYLLDRLIYIPTNYEFYTFEYPGDWKLEDFNSFQTVKPGEESKYSATRGGSQISVRKDYYIKTYGEWLQNPDNRVEESVSFNDFSVTHETADGRQNWSLFYKNREDYEYHFNLSPRSYIGDEVLGNMVRSLEVHEIKIYFPWLMYPLAFGYQVIAIIDMIIPIL